MTLILRTIEATVLEGFRTGKTQRDIAKELGVPSSTLVNITARLRQLSAVKHTGQGKYTPLIDQYECSDEINKGTKRSVGIQFPISERQEKYIREHYGQLPRRIIAQHLKLDKFTLNTMIQQLKLGE